MHFAAYVGAEQCARALLRAGAHVNATDAWRRTPLFYAESRGKRACARVLAGQGGRLQHLGGGQQPQWDLSADYVHDPNATDREIESQ